MALNFLSHEVSDLCLGKPPLKSLPKSATVGEALSALKKCGESYLSVWNCDHNSPEKAPVSDSGECICIGKVCMVDIVCYLCREENILSPASALKSPLSDLLPKVPGLVRHVERHCSLLEALDLILEGAQNLIVPIQSKRKKLQKNNSILNSTHSNYLEFCCLTQEDIIRFFLNCIGIFSPIPALSIASLGIIRTDILAVGYHDSALSAVDSIALALSEQTSVAVISPDSTLIGEISPSTLAACDETIAPAIIALSAGELMAYIDCGGPPEDLVRTLKLRLREGNLEGMLEILGEFSNSSSFSSSSEEDDSSVESLPEIRRYSRTRSYSARMIRRSEAIVCHPGSSIVAVMIQALAHRVNYVWVIEDDDNLVGIVTFPDVLKVFREHLQSSE
ncbi:CBS domain-containing protein CBSX5-like [Tasmannia lanceolata]|uniref:CBS domain-containing protein CBSX5-like n=1 Tax=Tasmannia lanceolata TaxID=3420 RepID=UPI00406443B2